MKKGFGLAIVLGVILIFNGCNLTQSENKILGIIGAMEEEVEILKSKMQIHKTQKIAGMEFYQGKLEGKDVVLVRSGVGKVNMASCTQILIDRFHITHLLNSGVAGTLDPSLNQGDIVISEDAVQHDFDTTIFGNPLGEIARLGIISFVADEKMLEIAKNSAQKLPNLKIKIARVASGDQFISDRALIDKIRANFGDVGAVEMEGGAMAQVAYLNQIPFIIIRSISDKAEGNEAKLSYEEFLPLAAKNASDLVMEFVRGF